MVKRIPITLERRKKAMIDFVRDAKAKEREKLSAEKRITKQRNASDFGVLVDGYEQGTYDKLRGKGGALAKIRELKRQRFDAKLVRIYRGEMQAGIFHGCRFVHWAVVDADGNERRVG